MKRGAEDLALLLLRLGFGLGMALAHGLPKLQALLAGDARFVQGVAQLGFPYPYAFAWISALTEVVGGVAVALGLFTRPFAGLNIVNMVVAAFVRHRAYQQLLGAAGIRVWTEDQLKAWGRPELALLYLLGFAAIAILGAGLYSVDGVMVGGRRKTRRNYD